MLHTVVLVLANAVGLLFSFGAIIMLMAGGANAKPAQIVQIKWMMAAVAGVLAGCILGSVLLFRHDRPWLASATGLAPAGFVVVLVWVLVRIRW